MTSSLTSRSTRLALGAYAALLLAACSGGPGPDRDELEAELVASHLPASWTLKPLDITVQENMGTEVEPVVALRFSAEVEPQQDLYKPTTTSRAVEAENNSPVRYLAGRRVVQQATEAGTAAEIFGVARSTQRGEGWAIRIDLENRPWRTAGDPLSDFGSDYVIAGSPEETELIEQVNAEWRAEQQRKEEEEQRKLAEMRRLNEATLERLATGRASLVAEDGGTFVEAVAEFEAPEETDERFDFNVYFDGVMYTYNAVVRNGGIVGGDPEGQCQFLLAPEADEGEMTGASRCSLMPGELSFEATTAQQLDEQFAEADRNLMSFFETAKGGPVLNWRQRNLTFGGVDTYGLTVTDIRDGLIYADILRRGEKVDSALWYVKYGKLRPRAQQSAWWYLAYASPRKLEGRRYTNRPNRPIGMTLEFP
ncbi:MAG: hypothetical protein GVY11_02370 [Gammaproteobacteria bacterium]|jgi:hypothetical protein|nr:hypothetical protein [Gammaproteobacteria bacterium]